MLQPLTRRAFLLLFLLALAAAQCPSGWQTYTDDGSEGHNSCYRNFGSVWYTWTQANASCPTNSHLLTIKATTYPSAFTSRINTTGLANSAWMGCYQLYAQPARNVGWQWVDGTSNASLGQNSTYNAVGYGLWRASSGEPK